MRIGLLLGAAGLVGLSMAVTARDAAACGGCFHGPSQNGDVITDHRMIFQVSPQQTSLYDEIEYSGNPAGFAWVLPIHGQVTVGLSSDIVFASLDQATQTTIEAPNLPACASCSCDQFDAPTAGGGAAAADAGAVNGVTVISQQTVGPYDTVQLSSTNPNALSAWLTANGYSIPADVQPIVAAYVSEGFDFLALRLTPGQGVSAMRPVRVTSTGAGLTLPLRMVAAGTGPTVGITLWIVGAGRYEPQNFQSFIISASELTWDWTAQSSNYTTIRSQKEASLDNAAWQIESALQLSPYQIEQPILNDDAATDYMPVPADDAGDPGETADQVRQDDLSALFPNTQNEVWVTRIRSDLAHAALANDLVLQASADQSVLSNIYQVTKSVNAPSCPAVPNPCPPCGTGGGSPFGAGSNPPLGSPFGTSGGTSTGSSNGHSGCSTAPEDRGGTGVEFVLAGLAAVAVFGKRRRRP
jgi:MYXO-CTERM domain-containing protein